MKKYYLLLILLIVAGSIAKSQVAVNNDGSVPNSSAMLDIKSTDKGVLIPRMTATQRDAIGAPVQGLLVFINDDSSFYYYKDTSWIELSTGKNAWSEAGNNIYCKTTARVGIGTNVPKFSLDIENNNKDSISLFVSDTNSDTYQHYGCYTSIMSTGSGIQVGLFQGINNYGAGNSIGLYNWVSGSGNGDQYGIFHYDDNYGSGSHYGSYNYMTGYGDGRYFGTYNSIYGLGIEDQYGTFDTISCSGSGTYYGAYHVIAGDGDGFHYGVFNWLSGSGSGQQFGAVNYIDNSGNTSDHVGVVNHLDGQASSTQYGVLNMITNSGNGSHYGVYNSLTGTGNGNKYGIYDTIPESTGGTHYGVYSCATGNANYAGYFNGNVYVTKKVKTFVSGDSDLKAYIYGSLKNDGTIYTSESTTGFTCTRVSTGAYQINFTNYSSDKMYLVMANAWSSASPIVVTYVKQIGYFTIYTWDLSGNPVNTLFNFVVYKK